jgi:hypothetical protein
MFRPIHSTLKNTALPVGARTECASVLWQKSFSVDISKHSCLQDRGLVVRTHVQENIPIDGVGERNKCKGLER